MDAAAAAAGLSRLRRAREGERRLPAVRPRQVPRRRDDRGARPGRQGRDRRTRHPQRAADLDRADRHDLAARRQRLVGPRAGVQLQLHAQRADARQHAPHRGGQRLRLAPLQAPVRRDRRAARLFRRRAAPVARRPRGDAGGGAEIRRRLDLQDHQLPGGHLLRGVQGRLPAGLRAGLQGLHDLPPQPGDRLGAVAQGRREEEGVADPAGAALQPPAGAARRPVRRRRRRLHDAAARPARGAARQDLQGQMAGQRARHLHHHQRRGDGRPAAPVRGVHQLQEHGALRLDRGADAHDLRGVPARRRRVVRGRGAEGGVRPARRPVDGRALRALAAGGDRRGDRAPHDRYRLPPVRPARRRSLHRRPAARGRRRQRAAPRRSPPSGVGRRRPAAQL